MPKNEAMKSALKSLMSEMGGMNMERVRKMKAGPPKTAMGKEPKLPKKKRMEQHARMGDPDMDD